MTSCTAAALLALGAAASAAWPGTPGAPRFPARAAAVAGAPAPAATDQPQSVHAAWKKLLATVRQAQGDAEVNRAWRRVRFDQDGRGFCAYTIEPTSFTAPFDPKRNTYLVEPVRYDQVRITYAWAHGDENTLTFDLTGRPVTWSGGSAAPHKGGLITVSSDEGEYRLTVMPGTGKLAAGGWTPKTSPKTAATAP
jgi:hypothetical protein